MNRQPPVPHVLPVDARDLLIERLAEPGLSGLSSEQRAHVRNLTAEVYASGHQGGRVSQMLYDGLDRELDGRQFLDGPDTINIRNSDGDVVATKSLRVEKSDVQTHRWQTVRVIGVGPVVAQATGDEDDEPQSYPVLLKLRCTCGTWAKLNAEATGLAIPPCPEEDR